MKPKVIILSAAKRSGKTTALKKWVQGRSDISGFLSPDVDGIRMFENIETGEMIPMEDRNGDLEIGRFVFDSSGFEKVEKSIKKSWEEGVSEYLVIDEIGPLEINKNLGFHELLLYLQKNMTQNSPILFLVVRDYLLDEFLTKYGFEDVKISSLEEFSENYLL